TPPLPPKNIKVGGWYGLKVMKQTKGKQMKKTKEIGDRVLQIYCDVVKTAKNPDSKIYGGNFDNGDKQILEHLSMNESACAFLAVEIFKQELKSMGVENEKKETAKN